jgi:hypothetical protein
VARAGAKSGPIRQSLELRLPVSGVVGCNCRCCHRCRNGSPDGQLALARAGRRPRRYDLRPAVPTVWPLLYPDCSVVRAGRSPCGACALAARCSALRAHAAGRPGGADQLLRAGLRVDVWSISLVGTAPRARGHMGQGPDTAHPGGGAAPVAPVAGSPRSACWRRSDAPPHRAVGTPGAAGARTLTAGRRARRSQLR